MSVNLSPVGGAGAQFSDNNGHPLNGGKLYTYQAGTTTPAATYTSVAGSVFHPNPIILNAGGRVPDSGEIWLADNISYKFVLKTSADVLIATWDNINGINSNFVNYTVQEEVITATAGQTVFNLSTITYAPATNSLAVYIDGVNQIVTDSYIETDSNTVTFVSGLHEGALVKFTTAVPATGTATDASVVSYTAPYTGAVAYTVEDKLAQTVSVKDFGAVGDGVTDDTAAIQAAIDSGSSIFMPNSRDLTFKLTSTVSLYGGGRSYDFGFATFTTDSTFAAFSHKVFTADTGPNSGQYFTLKNLLIIGNAANRYNTSGAGFRVNKDLIGPGYAIYDGTFENITVQNMYYGFDDIAQSGLWMTKFKHLKFINCPAGFSKSVGTTISFENCYALGGHRGFLLDKVYGFDMIACACDAGTDYNPTFLDQRVLVTSSEGNIHSLRMEQQTSATDSILRIDSSKLNIGVISLSNATLDATSGSVYAVKLVNSDINLSKVASGVAIAVTGANTSAIISASGSSLDLENCDLPEITGTSVYKVSNFNSYVFGYGLKDSEVLGTSGYYQKDNKVTLYVSGTGSDTNTGLTTSHPLQTMAGVFAAIQKYYVNHDVTVKLRSNTTFTFDGANVVQLLRLSILNDSGVTGSLQFNVSGGVVSKLYGPKEIILNVTGLSINGAPASFTSGIIFPSAVQDVDYSLDSVQIKASTITLPANGCLTGCVLFGYNGMMSVGIRDAAITGDSVTTSYVCYLGSGTAQVTRGGGSIANCGLTNGTQIATSNLYFA